MSWQSNCYDNVSKGWVQKENGGFVLCCKISLCRCSENLVLSENSNGKNRWYCTFQCTKRVLRYKELDVRSNVTLGRSVESVSQALSHSGSFPSSFWSLQNACGPPAMVAAVVDSKDQGRSGQCTHISRPPCYTSTWQYGKCAEILLVKSLEFCQTPLRHIRM